MHLLADENFPFDAVEALRHNGHDVVWVRTDAPGINDETVLAWAVAENRLLVTFDKDFGELAFHYGLPATSGIILFRLTPNPIKVLVSIIVRTINQDIEWVGHFSVVDNRRIRMRKLPHSPQN